MTETDVRKAEIWYGPLNQADREELSRLELKDPDKRSFCEIGDETWAVFPDGVPEEAMPAITFAIASGRHTVGTLEAVQRREAVARLRMLERKGLHPNVTKELEVEGLVHYSKKAIFGKGTAGILYWINDDNFAEIVRKLEKSEGILVYHATHERTGIGEQLDLFFVSKHTEEWAMDREDIEVGQTLAYVVNMSDDMLSEYGTIGFAVSGGGLVRRY